MNDFVPRLIGKPEAIRLGIQDGWYGIKVSGTFVTERCESLAVCKAAIDLIPVQAEVEFAGPPPRPLVAMPFHKITGAEARAAHQISRLPLR